MNSPGLAVAPAGAGGSPEPAPAPRRVVIADDEPLARERLRQLLARHPGWEVAAECADGPAAVAAIGAARPDLVLLDVRMPGLDGLAVADAVAGATRAGGGAPAVVFVTAYDAFALPAFDVSAVDYLLKPVDRERFARALARVEARLAPHGPPAAALRPADPTAAGGPPDPAPHAQRFLVRSPRGHYFVPAADVAWVAAEGNYAALYAAPRTPLYAGGRAHLVRATMRALEARLDPAAFARVHRSAIVNVAHVERVVPLGRGEYRLHLAGGHQLETGRAYRSRLRALLRG
jgi:two-component system LytT family response regulator